jgi:hypothetical protein
MLSRSAFQNKQPPAIFSGSPSLARMAGHLAQVLLGSLLFFTGVVLVFTLVLMPIGVPLALAGVALIAASGDS